MLFDQECDLQVCYECELFKYCNLLQLCIVVVDNWVDLYLEIQIFIIDVDWMVCNIYVILIIDVYVGMSDDCQLVVVDLGGQILGFYDVDLGYCIYWLSMFLQLGEE